MPHKHNAARRHRILRARYRVRNWRAYEAGLGRRGDVTLTGLQYGVLARLTVYAVPQVLAATAPIGTAAVHMGTLVRVLMLGPVVLGLSLLTRRLRDKPDEAAPHVTASDHPALGKLPLHKLVPWFIMSFLVLAGLRLADLVSHAAFGPMAAAASLLTVVSLAALGLDTALRVVARAGTRVAAAVTLSLMAPGAINLGLIGLLSIA